MLQGFISDVNCQRPPLTGTGDDMKLYIVRHGIAVPHGAPGIAEDERPLTPEGITKMEKAAAGLRTLGVSPQLVLTSPLSRAEQTAEIVAAALEKRPELRRLHALEPGGNHMDVYRELEENQDLESLMIVGHQPSLGEIAGEIAWGSAKYCLELKKGGACALEIESVDPKPRGTLLWLLTPSVLRQLAE